MKKLKIFSIFIFSFGLLVGINKTIFASSNLINKEYKSINIYEKFDIKTIQYDSGKKYQY